MKHVLLIIVLTTSLLASAQVYKDRNASPQERAESIVSEMTLQEKISMMLFNSPGIPRLGIEQYNWWNEALHGVGRAGTATIYPQPIGMAATFDDRLIYDVFCTVSDEARAKHHKAKKEGPLQIYQGLTFWTPNVNIYRDPRWGRGHETYGEDPYLTSKMGVSVVSGLQGDFYDGGAFDADKGVSDNPTNRYYKTNGCAKHYAVHSGPEWNRHSFDAKDVSQRDLWETYLPSFKALVQEGNVRQVMCAYNRFEGEPCCGSPRLLTKILREQWGYDGIVVTDCWAIDDFFYPDRHNTDPSKESAAAKAVRAGTDLECGPTLKSLDEAVKLGLITEEEIDRSVIRLMKARYELGEMDPDSCVEWAQIPFEVVDCQKHKDLALDVARKTMVLLKNDGVLPLNKSMRIGLIGPNANDSVMQWGNYNGFPTHTSTLLSALQDRLPQDQIVYVPGIDHTSAVKLDSRFSNTIAPSGKVGFDAVFWKMQNVEDSDEPYDVEWHYNTPLQLTSAGATVWAPDVPLGRFTALFTTKFVPERSEDITFSIQSQGATDLYVNGERVFHGNNQKTVNAYTFPAEAGKEYDIALKFYANEGDNASLNFDFGASVPMDIDNIVEKLSDCDVILFAGGLSPMLEGEEMSIKIDGFYRGDRTIIELPQIQTQLLQALNQTGKPVVFVNYSGSCVGLEREEKIVDAILQAWYPGLAGGEAVVDVLFGDYNPSGKLPLTFFRSTADLPDFEDYHFDNGRSYRYFKGDPLFHFGHGLSYTEFEYGEAKYNREGEKFILSIPVTNTGGMAGDEIVQIYVGRESDPWGPSHALRAFKRVSIQPGQTEVVEITMEPEQFEWFDEDTDSMRVFDGEYTLYYGTSSDKKQLKSIKVEME